MSIILTYANRYGHRVNLGTVSKSLIINHERSGGRSIILLTDKYRLPGEWYMETLVIEQFEMYRFSPRCDLMKDYHLAKDFPEYRVTEACYGILDNEDVSISNLLNLMFIEALMQLSPEGAIDFILNLTQEQTKHDIANLQSDILKYELDEWSKAEPRIALPSKPQPVGLILCHGRSHRDPELPEWLVSKNVDWVMVDARPDAWPDVVADMKRFSAVDKLGAGEWDYIIEIGCPIHASKSGMRMVLRISNWLLRPGGQFVVSLAAGIIGDHENLGFLAKKDIEDQLYSIVNLLAEFENLEWRRDGKYIVFTKPLGVDFQLDRGRDSMSL